MAAVIAWSDADAFFGMGWLGGSLSLGESDAWGSRADINVCQMAERLPSCTVHVCSPRLRPLCCLVLRMQNLACKGPFLCAACVDP